MRNFKYKIYTLGCKVNQYDSNVLSGMLNSFGFVLAPKKADLIIINTCSVTKIATRKSRQMLVKLKKQNPKAKFVMFGCFPKIYPEEAKKLPVDLISEVGDFENLATNISSLFEIRKDFLNKDNELLAKTNKKRYTLKIQEGCEQYCTYCIIPFTRGKLKSRSIKDVLDETKQAIKHGYKEIVITGTHLGLYNNGGNNLVFLLKKIVKLEGLGRIRLSSIEINEVTDELIQLLKNSKKICKHLHIALQSGSDKILKLMNRPYDSLFFEEKINRIRKSIPNIAISTDVIVGFPGEGDNDFKDSYNLASKLKFSRLHVFSFSAHEMTPAAKMNGVVNGEKIKERSEKLRNLNQRLVRKFRDKFKGEKLDVLVEKCNGPECSGKTEYYFTISFKNAKILKKGKNISSVIGKIFEVDYR